MGFVKKNFKAIILVLFALLSELIYLPFSVYEHSALNGAVYSYGDVLYSFFSQLGYLTFLPALFLYWSEKNIDSKGIYLGLVVWNGLEMLQEINYLFKLNIDFLQKNQSTQSDIMQSMFIIFIVILTYFGFKKWFILSPLLLRTLRTFTPIGITLIRWVKGLKKPN